MALSNDGAERRRRIEASAPPDTTQTQRPRVATPQTLVAWAHIREIVDLESDFVPVRRVVRKRTTDDTIDYEYKGDTEMVLCEPGLKARHYRPFEFRGEAWSSDARTIRLYFVDGAWHASHIGIVPLTSEQLQQLSQNVPIVDCRPGEEMAGFQ